MASTLEKIRQQAEEAKRKKAGQTGGQMIPLDKIDFDQSQPRQDFYPPDGVIGAAVQEQLEDLAASLKINGQQSEITVMEQENGRYLIAVGERRVRAAMLNGWTEIRAIIRNDLSGIKLKLYRLAENIDRADVAELDTARYIAGIVAEGGMKKSEIAAHFGKKPAWVTRFLAFADDTNFQKWVKPGYVQKAWILYAVLQLPEHVQAEVYRTCEARGAVELTSQELRHYESQVKRGVQITAPGEEPPATPSQTSPEDTAMAAARIMMTADTSEQRDGYVPPKGLSPKNLEKHSGALRTPENLSAAGGGAIGDGGDGSQPSTDKKDGAGHPPTVVMAQLSVAQLSAILVKLQKSRAKIAGTLQSLAVDFRLPEPVIREALEALGESNANELPPLLLGLKLAEAGHKLTTKG